MELPVLRGAETSNGNSASVIRDAKLLSEEFADCLNAGDCCNAINKRRQQVRFVSDLAVFRINAENRDIPRVWRDFPDSLALEGNADKPGSKPVPAVAEKSECAIKVTAAHADTVPLTIECNERSDDDIEFTCAGRLSRNGLPETEVVHRELRFGQRFAKQQKAVRAGYRQENALFCAPCALDDCSCIYLVPHWQVTTYRVAAHEITAVEKTVCDSPGSVLALLGGHRTACFPGVESQGLHRGR